LCLQFLYLLKMLDHVQLLTYRLLYDPVVELANSNDWYSKKQSCLNLVLILVIYFLIHVQGHIACQFIHVKLNLVHVNNGIKEIHVTTVKNNNFQYTISPE
jgi:hypothetical protein